MDAATLKTRFAPSPTGALHAGNARTALFSWLLARGRGGRFLLRIEDTDQARNAAGGESALLHELAWLGLDWDEGPGRDTGPGPWRQSERSPIHQQLFHRLEAAGQAYPCFCTEAELARTRRAQQAAGKPPRYPGTCAALDAATVARRQAAGEPAALRLRGGGTLRERTDLVRGPLRETEAPADFVIRRADGSAAFLFANAVDDALMEVTHVLRGEDHLTNTWRQLRVLEALDLPVPAYGHLPLLLDGEGAPLSKRRGSASLAELRSQGILPLALANCLARLGHHYEADALLGMDALAGGFELERVGRAPARFDPEQLRHWQQQALAAAPETLERWLEEWGVSVPREHRQAFLDAVRPNVSLPGELADWAGRLFGPPPALDSGPLAQAGAGFFEAAEAAAREAAADYGEFCRRLKAATGRKGRGLFLPLRLALTGRCDGPELARIWALLPAAEREARLARARARAAAD